MNRFLEPHAQKPETAKSELQLQAQCFQWAWNNYPETRRLLFAVPNGGTRDVREAQQLKASGVVPGIPDLLFFWRSRLHAFELKTERGVLSDNQAIVHVQWGFNGCTPHIIRDFETFKLCFLSIIGADKIPALQ